MNWFLWFLDFVFFALFDGWFQLMQWIVPNKIKSRKSVFLLKLLVAMFCIALVVCVLFGISFLISKDEHLKNVGWCMIFVPIALSVMQIVVGVILKYRVKK